MALIEITRSGSVVKFEPDPAELDATVDFAVWVNRDPEQEHQPSLPGKPANWWMNTKLAKYVEGEPADTSPVINLTPKKDPVTDKPILDLTYVDGLDDTIVGHIKFVTTPLP